MWVYLNVVDDGSIAELLKFIRQLVAAENFGGSKLLRKLLLLNESALAKAYLTGRATHEAETQVDGGLDE